MLRVAQGRLNVACGAIRRALSATTDRLERLTLLPAGVDIVLAAGEVDAARAASRELTEIAKTFDTEALKAASAHAQGAVDLATGDASCAFQLLRQAWRLWQQVGAPYLAVRSLVHTALACRLLRDADGCELALFAARASNRSIAADLRLSEKKPSTDT